MNTKYLLTSLSIFFYTVSVFAQFEAVEQSVTDFSAMIRRLTPAIMGTVFLISMGFQWKNFFGEEADIKKGITRILLFLAVAGSIVGVTGWIFNLNI